MQQPMHTRANQITSAMVHIHSYHNNTNRDAAQLWSVFLTAWSFCALGQKTGALFFANCPNIGISFSNE